MTIGVAGWSMGSVVNINRLSVGDVQLTSVKRLRPNAIHRHGMATQSLALQASGTA
jgi:hypothetical protein